MGVGLHPVGGLHPPLFYATPLGLFRFQNTVFGVPNVPRVPKPTPQNPPKHALNHGLATVCSKKRMLWWLCKYVIGCLSIKVLEKTGTKATKMP